MKAHPKEHLPILTTIEDVKSQTLKTLKNEAVSRFSTYVEDILKSNKVNGLFKEALGTLMQQNTTVDLDDQDVADILADTLQRKYFEMKFMMEEKIPENPSIKPFFEDLVAFDFEFDGCDGNDNHEKTARKFCITESGYYCTEDIESFYVDSIGEGIFWNVQDQTLIFQDPISSQRRWKRCKTPLPFRFLTVLEFVESEQLLVVAASENQFTVYLIEEKSRAPLKICKEFPQEEEILFLASDNASHLFVVTDGESGLTATISELQDQNNELELLKLISFKPFDLPKRVVFDHINNLLFILAGDLLQIYKYPKVIRAPLQVIFKIESEAFSWHQATQRLFLIKSGELYQFIKGKFRLIRVIMNHLIRSIGLTNQGILCLKDKTKLCLLSYENPNNQKFLSITSRDFEMSNLQEKAMKMFNGLDDEVDPRIGDLETTFNSIQVVAETPDYLVIYANITDYQGVEQRCRDSWQECGGTIFTQQLIEYKINTKKNS